MLPSHENYDLLQKPWLTSFFHHYILHHNVWQSLTCIQAFLLTSAILGSTFIHVHAWAAINRVAIVTVTVIAPIWCAVKRGHKKRFVGREVTEEELAKSSCCMYCHRVYISSVVPGPGFEVGLQLAQSIYGQSHRVVLVSFSFFLSLLSSCGHSSSCWGKRGFSSSSSSSSRLAFVFWFFV